MDLHRFSLAISCAVVNYDGNGCIAPDPLVWSSGALPKRRRLGFVTGQCCLVHQLFWDSEWINVPGPAGGMDLGVGGISYVELLILFELWAGERLSLEKAQPRHLRTGRPISVSSVPFGPGIDIWRSCRFICAMMRSLCLLPGGFGGFLPCSTGANHCWLRHIGWEKCGHGLTSRPRESASEVFLDESLQLFNYPPSLLVHCLLGRFPLGTALLGLPVRSPLGVCLCLIMLLAWSLLILGSLMMVRLRLLVRGFAGSVVLDQHGK